MKKTCIIILITLSWLAFVETACWVYRQVIGREHIGLFWVKGAGLDISDPCNRYIFDLQLGYVHDETTGCKVRDAEIVPGFIHYHSNPAKTNPLRIVTLGGSGTDGFLAYNNGYSWPYWLNRLCSVSNTSGCDVYNGGMGGFSSSRELKKLFRDVLVLKPAPNIIISFDGDNDLPGLDDGPLIFKYPYYDNKQILALDQEKFQPPWDIVEIFPNTLRMLRKIVSLKNSDMLLGGVGISEKYAAVLPEAHDIHNRGDLWKRNVVLMHGIAEAIGAKYLVFLQPTLGLTDQDPRLMGKNDQKLFASLDPKYVADLNDSFDSFRKECKTLNYCVDLTGLFSKGLRGRDIYHDQRHQNPLGTKIIAERILEELKKRGLIPQ